MGYTARYDGEIYVRSSVSKETLESLRKLLSDALTDNFELINCNDFISYTIYPDETKYHSIEVWEMLREFAPYTVGGELRFMGEDESIWKFVFQNNVWEEIPGYIVFSSDEAEKKLNDRPLPYGELLDAFVTYVNNDAEAADLCYVRDALAASGLSEDKAKALGFTWLYDEEEDE